MNQSFRFIRLMELMGILTLYKGIRRRSNLIEVLVIFRTMRDCDRQENNNTGLAIAQKMVETPGGRIT
ncbi:MAG: hypothetical protein V7K57_25775 [Nostoc sp.]|uniref:hypothetical protein n=1 Tax=Nostoc sp. TaxID=1180 RepID=UPI002FFD1674